MKKQNQNGLKMTHSIIAAGVTVGLLGFVTGCGQSKVDFNRDMRTTNVNTSVSSASTVADSIESINLYSVERLALGYIPRQCTGQTMDRIIIPEFDVLSARAIDRLRAAGIPDQARVAAATSNATSTATGAGTSTAPSTSPNTRGLGALAGQIQEFRAQSTPRVAPERAPEVSVNFAEATRFMNEDLESLGLPTDDDTTPRNRFLRYDVFTFPTRFDTLDHTAISGELPATDHSEARPYVAGTQRSAEIVYFQDYYPRSPWGAGSLFYSLFELNPTIYAHSFSIEQDLATAVIPYRGLFAYLNPTYQRRVMLDYVRLSRLGRMGYQMLSDESIVSPSLTDEERLSMYEERYNRLLSFGKIYDDVTADLRQSFTEMKQIVDANNRRTFSGYCDLFGEQESRCRNYFSVETCQAFCRNRLTDLGAVQPGLLAQIDQLNSIFSETGNIAPGQLSASVTEVSARLPSNQYLSWLAESMHAHFPRGLEWAQTCVRQDANLPIASVRQVIQNVTERRAAEAAALRESQEILGY